ncbi:AAA-domain-containing protein [Mycena floridula]|nr:AAA-domain-containing protein [Mycena floridula]
MSLDEFVCKTAFTSKKDPDFKGTDTVLLGKRIWDALTSSSEPRDLCVSITCTRRVKPQSVTQHVAVPSEWTKKWPRNEVLIREVQPVQLIRVFVTALSDESYRVASTSPATIESWLSGDHVILRQGSVLTFTSDLLPLNGHGSPSRSLQYRIDMLEPVLQGSAAVGITRFHVTSGQQTFEEEEQVDTDSENIEIDEVFMANSVANFRPAANQEHAPKAEAYFQVEPLGEPFSPSAEDYTLYVRIADLGRIGILDGDWAVSRSELSKFRLTRIIANDDLVNAAGVLTGSPVLLRNILADTWFQSTRSISLRPSPFGSGEPVIPTARSITVARVGSPFSVDRAYEPLFLRGLKDHFGAGRRIVKQGDLLAVAIDTNSVQIGSPGSISRGNELVYFCITNIDHDVLPSETIQSASFSFPDMYLGSTAGELGCWIDPATTRIVQTGVEHSRVPDLDKYLDIDVRGRLNATDFPTLCGPDGPFHKLLLLASAALEKDAVHYNLNMSILLTGSRGIGKFTTAKSVARQLGLHMLEVNCFDLLGENDTKTEGTLRARFAKASDCSPCMLVLRQLDALSQTTQPGEPGKDPVLANALRECIESILQSWKETGHPVVVCGTTADASQVSTSIQSSFKHEVHFQAPAESHRLEILKSLLSDATLSPDVGIEALATQTAALLPSDLHDLVLRAELAAMKQACSRSGCVVDVVQAGITFTNAHFIDALGSARASYSESIGAPKIPNVSWDDVGGLAHVKSDILDTIQLPLDHPELFADGLKKRSGILLYGPPGTGKTLVAKAVATSFSLNFFSVKGPELLNMYIGESEANVRRVFQRARDAKPCVIFFDELDSIAPKRGNQGDSGGVMDRIVSQLLAELDGMSDSSGEVEVFVLGATNRPDLLDPALLRPGRFDRMLYLGVSTSHTEQLNILQALTRKFALDSNLDLAVISEQCPFNYTGADFYALCADALLNAMTRTAELLDKKIECLNNGPPDPGHPYPLTSQYYLAEIAKAEDMNVIVTQDDFERALAQLVPSVSESEMNHYASIQQRFSQEQLYSK